MELDDLPKEKLKELIHEVTDDIQDDENLDYGDENLVDDDANLDVVLMIMMMEVQHNLVSRKTSHQLIYQVILGQNFWPPYINCTPIPEFHLDSPFCGYS